MHDRVGSRRRARPRLRSGVERQIAPIIALLLSIGFTFNGLDTLSGNPTLFLLCGAMLALLLLLDAPPRLFWTRALPILALVLLAYGWATLPLWAPAQFLLRQGYIVPDLLLPRLLGAAGLLAAFLAGAMLGARRNALANIIDWMLLFGCVNVIGGLILREYGTELPWDIWRPRQDMRFTGTLSNANVAGTYYGMLALLALGRIVSDPAIGDGPVAQAWRAARWVGLLLCAGACAITASRSAMAGTLLGLTGIGLLHFLRRKGFDSWLVPLLLLLGAGGVLAVGLVDMLFARASMIAEGTAGRTMMWGHYWHIARQAPWFGYGLGSFPDVNQQMLTDPRTAQALWMVNAPHNLILRFLIDGGVPFLLLLTIAMLVIVRRIAANLSYYGPLDGRAGVVAAIFTALLCSMVDIALDIPALAAMTLFLIGLLWERHQFGSRSASKALTVRHRSMKGK
ncbi:O-antigen ligase family protein [Sphingobium sp. Ant17]|uniref:O-antigen ligase family protein n=1 Tax=Sphingobium sp. Ant17 TaxID=1461752 RepID=UPI0004464C31|nr:O-antigen ligase family protein [Sphingobium sp. Ant17]EXS71990.1 hypothetical protein BF95_10635 [Sphingobium sp. Ant17]